MSQKFKNIQGTDYIDTGILDLQDRDDSVLTMFYGDTEPSDKIPDLVWNDTRNKKIKQWNESEWVELIDYSKRYVKEVSVNLNYQPLSSNLTTYSQITEMSSAIGFINISWIPMSYFFINNYNNLSTGIGLKNLAYKSKITVNEISNYSISNSKITPTLITQPVFVTGDCIISFNSGNKTGCVKLSKTSNTVYTIGATASSSTYKGDSYKNLFQYIWSNYNLPIYTSAGVKTSKSSSWLTDWNNNKRLELPHIDLPETNIPSEKTITSGSSSFKISKSGYYKIILVSGGGGSAATSAGTAGHEASCTGASGGAFEGILLLNQNDTITYTIGVGGTKGKEVKDNRSEGTAGGNTVIKLNNSNLVTCYGGGGGTAIWRHNYIIPTGGSATIHMNVFESNSTKITKGPDGNASTHSTTVTVKGPLNNDYGKGGDAYANSSSKCWTKNGNAGYFNIKFLSPKEYGTSDSGVKSTLDALYNGIYYFMKC